LLKCITKDATELANSLSIVYEAKEYVAKYPSRAIDSVTSTRNVTYLLNRIADSLSEKYEISSMMAASSTLGMPSNMSSHGFWYCYIYISYIWPAVRDLRKEILKNQNESSDNDGEVVQEIAPPPEDNAAVDANPEAEDEDEFEFEQRVFDDTKMCKNTSEGSAKVYKVNDSYIPIHQHVHYMYRGPALETLNFLEYCGIIEIQAKRIDMAPV
jgi:hypothetical protein